jgi:predicted RecA/RadA family phage recombinase
MAQSYSEGQVVNVTTPTGGYANGQLVVINGLPGVVLETAAAGANVAVAVEGVFNVASNTAGTAAVGTRAFYSTVTGTRKRVVFATGAATGVTGARAPVVGIVWEAKASGAARTTVPIKLVGGPMPLLKNN